METSDLVRKLQSGKFSDEKILAATELLTHEEHFLPCKVTFLLDWVCNVLIKTSEKRSTSESLTASDDTPAFLRTSTWEFMRQILESPQCAPTEIVHPKILNVIGRVLCYVAACYTLKEDGIREYADDMLQLSKVVSQVYAVLLDKFALSFRPSVDDSTKFVADVVNTARSIGGLPVCPEYVVKSLTLAVKALHTNCLQQANAKKIFSLITSKLFEPMMSLLHQLEGMDATNETLVELANSTENLLTFALFQPNHIPEYAAIFESRRNYLKSLDKEQRAKRRKVSDQQSTQALFGSSASYPRQLFEKLQAIANEHSNEVTSFSFSFVFKKFFASISSAPSFKRALGFKKLMSDAGDTAMEVATSPERMGFEMFAILVDILIPILQTNEQLLAALAALLEALVTADIYKPAAESEDKAQSAKLMECTNIVVATLQAEQPNSMACCFKCLKSLVELNHSLVDPLFPLFLTLTWQSKDVPASADEFWATVVDTMSALRQLDNFIKRLLDVLRDEPSAPITFFERPNFWNALAHAMEKLPQGQIDIVWKQLSESLTDDFTAPLLAHPSETASMKLMFASKIFITFIKNIRVSSEALAITLLDRWRETLDSAVAPILLPFLSAASSNKKHKHKQKVTVCVYAMLSLYHSMMTFKELCMRKYSAYMFEEENLVNYFEPIQSQVTMQQLLSSIDISEVDPMNRHVFFVLAIQRIKQILIKVKTVPTKWASVDPTELEAPKSEAEHIIRTLTNWLLDSNQVADSECWKVVCSHLFLFESYLPNQVIIQLFQVILNKNDEPFKEMILTNALLFENKRLLELLVITLLREIITKMKGSLQRKKATESSHMIEQLERVISADDVEHRQNELSTFAQWLSERVKQTDVLQGSRKRKLDQVQTINTLVSLLPSIWIRYRTWGYHFNTLLQTTAVSFLIFAVSEELTELRTCLTASLGILAHTFCKSLSPSPEFLFELVRRLLALGVPEKPISRFTESWLRSLDSSELCEALACTQNSTSTDYYCQAVYIVWKAARAVPPSVLNSEQLDVSRISQLGIEILDKLKSLADSGLVLTHWYHTTATCIFRLISKFPLGVSVYKALQSYCEQMLRYIISTSLHDLESDAAAARCIIRVFKFAASMDADVVDKTVVFAIIIHKLQSASNAPIADWGKKALSGTFKGLTLRETTAILTYLVDQLALVRSTPRVRACLFILEAVLTSAQHLIPLGMYIQIINSLVSLASIQKSPLVEHALRLIYTCLLNKRIILSVKLVTALLEAFTLLLGTKHSPLSVESYLTIYKVLWHLIQSRPHHMAHNISALLLLIQAFISSALKLQGAHPKESQVVLQNAIRLYEALAKQVPQLKQFAAFVIVQLIELFQHETILLSSRNIVQQGVFIAMDMCGEKELDFVFKSLDDTGKSIFKTLFDEYNREYKFTGKV